MKREKKGWEDKGRDEKRRVKRRREGKRSEDKRAVYNASEGKKGRKNMVRKVQNEGEERRYYGGRCNKREIERIEVKKVVRKRVK